MQKQDILNKCGEVSLRLDSSDLSGAFGLLSEIIKEKNSYRLSDELEQQRQTYRYLTDYLLAGSEDSTRFDVYEKIIERLRLIADRITRDTIATDSSDIYSETVRTQRLSASSLSDLLQEYSSAYTEFTLAEAAGNETAEIHRRLEDLHNRIFNTVWTSFNDKETASLTAKTILSESFPEHLCRQMISALTLSQLGYFDPYKLIALLDIYQADLSEKFSARALTGIMFALGRHPRRAMAVKEIRDRLAMLEDSLLTYSRARDIMMCIIRTRDTERVSSKMKEEVIPELMKLRPDILKKMREGGADLEAGMMEDNPEWAEMLDKSGLSEKMRELSEMQSDGADLMMVAFSNLKQFPFFNTVSNWFLPFTENHSVVKGDEKEKQMLRQLMEIGREVCDSDKYSLAIALSGMPEMQKKMMASQIDAQFSQIREDLNDRQLKVSAPEFSEEATKTVRDLYRFFKLFRKRERLDDPFLKPFNFLNLPVIGSILSEDEIVSLVGEFYFSREYYNEALSLFNLLVENNADDASLWEKIGFCYQSMKFFENALEAYSKAELLKKPGTWLLKKLAYVNKQLGRYKEALGYYKAVLDKDPENVGMLMNAGFAALKSGNTDEALQYYYHANYLEPDNSRIMRSIAWCEFLNRNYAKSISYYEKVLAGESLPSDLLNTGHVRMLEGKFRDALECYRKAASGNMADFEKTFIADLPVLESLGLDPRIARIILDRVKSPDNF